MMYKKPKINRKKYIQTAILVVLLDNELHGYGISQKLQELKLFGGGLDNRLGANIGGVYTHLRKMEESGLILSAWHTEGPKKPRRVCSITQQGKIRLGEWIAEVAFDVASLFDLVERYRTRVGQS